MKLEECSMALPARLNAFRQVSVVVGLKKFFVLGNGIRTTPEIELFFQFLELVTGYTLTAQKLVFCDDLKLSFCGMQILLKYKDSRILIQNCFFKSVSVHFSFSYLFCYLVLVLVDSF